MWMMGYTDAGEFNTIQEPFTGRKLRPLMSRPVAAVPTTNHPPCVNRIHGVDHFLGLNHHQYHGMVVGQNKREVTTQQQVVVSSRWNPTPEQLQTLEELYRRGTRTPTAEQIQQITSQLRRYGKIEGKNVFYWFQNHKARERQKRRRRLDDDDQNQPNNNNNNNNNNQNEKEEKREPPGSSNRTAIEVEQTRNWAASPTNSSAIPEKTTQGASKGAEVQAECKAADHGWLHFEDEEILLQQRRNATWQMLHLSSASPSSSSSSPINNSSSIVVSTTQKQPHDHFLNHHGDEAQTLELFPLQSGRGLNGDEECGPTSDDHVMTSAPYQFFEFLPIKN